MITAIIQARMGSTRLPGKVMKNISGKPMLWHVVDRVKRAKRIDRIAVATTEKKADRTMIKLAERMGAGIFAGSEEDVLDRYYQAARKYGADVVVRITADCPLIDPEVIDKTIKFFLANDFDYVSTGRLKSTYPEGLDVEVFSFKALKKAWQEAKLPSEREHVTPYIWKNPKTFKIGEVRNVQNLSFLRWTVDEEKDLRFVRKIYKRLPKKFLMKDVLKLLAREPELTDINKGILKNEGYFKSLKKDKSSGNPATAASS